MSLVVQFLTDAVGEEDVLPATSGLAITVDGDEMRRLHFMDSNLASHRKIVPALPMAPIVPGTKGVIDRRVTEDGAIRSALVDDEALAGFEQGDKLFICVGGVVADVEAAGKESTGNDQHSDVQTVVEDGAGVVVPVALGDGVHLILQVKRIGG